MMLLVSRLVCRFAKGPLKTYDIEPEKLPKMDSTGEKQGTK